MKLHEWSLHIRYICTLHGSKYASSQKYGLVCIIVWKLFFVKRIDRTPTQAFSPMLLGFGQGGIFCKLILLAVFLALLHSLPLSPEFELNCLEFFLEQDFVALVLSLHFLLPLQHFLRPAISLTSFPFLMQHFSFKRLYGLGYSFRIFGTAK